MENKIVWIFGCSASGKTTLAEIFKQGYPDLVHYDGDNVRKAFNNDVGYSADDRQVNFSRLVSMVKLSSVLNGLVMVSAATPYRHMRLKIKELFPNSLVVWLDCPLDVREKRDPKGLYKKARNGELQNFIDIEGYEMPEALEYDLKIDTSIDDLEQCVEKIIVELEKN